MRRTCLFSALRCHLVGAVDDVTFHANLKTCRVSEGRGWRARLDDCCVLLVLVMLTGGNPCPLKILLECHACV